MRVLLPRCAAGSDRRRPRRGMERVVRHPARDSRFWSLALRSMVACGLIRSGFVPDRRPSRRAPEHNPSRTGDSAVQSLLQDVRYGCRLMWRSPGFTLAAVATLALGIGANSAIFSVLNVLSLKPLPYHDPARVAFVLGWDLDEGEMRFNLRQADFVDLQRQAQVTGVGGGLYVSQRQPHRWRHARARAGVPSHRRTRSRCLACPQR